MLISIVTPVYNGAHVLAETIQSVLDQTYTYFEHILVDDGSTDESENVVRSIQDNRIKYIKLPKNRGANVARNTGINAAKGEVVAFLDQDDLFHPEKLQKHVEFLNRHPDVGFTYNGRLVFIKNSSRVINIFIPPEKLNLINITNSHLLSPSDMVVRKEWIHKVGFFENTPLYVGCEISFLGKLILSGCYMARVDGIFNYRRYYEKRKFTNLEAKCASEMKFRDIVFSDPRCPEEVRATRNLSFAGNYLDYAKYAFMQNETELARKFLGEAVRLYPEFLKGTPPHLVTSLALVNSHDESESPEILINRIFAQLICELNWLDQYKNWSIAYRYLYQGFRKLVFARPELGKVEIVKARELGVRLDRSNMKILTHLILEYEIGLGSERADLLVKKLRKDLEEIGDKEMASVLEVEYRLNQAFSHYRNGNYKEVTVNVLKAIYLEPSYIMNRGVFSIFTRSLLKIPTQ